MADAEAIVEAALRPTVRFVEAKDEAAQARCMLFRVCDQLVRQRSQTVNSLRAFLAEFGQIAPVGMQTVSRLAAIMADTATPLPALARELFEGMLESIQQQPPWPVPTATLGGGAERKTGILVWRAGPTA